MVSDVNSEYDSILKVAFTEDLKHEIELLPTEMELERKHVFSKDFLRKINNLMKVKEKKYSFAFYAKKAAVIIFIIIGMGAGILAVSPQARASVQNIIMKWFNIYVEFNSKENDIRFNFNDFTFTLGYIPNEYEITDVLNKNNSKIIDFEKINNRNLKFSMTVLLNNGAHSTIVDNEKRIVEKININSLDGYIFKAAKGNEYNILVLYNEKIKVNIIGTVSSDELMKIAENIKIK